MVEQKGMYAVRAQKDNGSVVKALSILDVLARNFFHGFAPGELAKATELTKSDITRYVQTLESCGWVERIQETGRVRLSCKYARQAVQILNATRMAEEQVDQIIERINRK